MTNEEAIKVLKSKMDGHTDTSYEWVETVRMAIKALEQEPCEDCISREALMKLFKEYQPSLATRVCEFGDALEELPSVTPKTKWIPVTERLPEKSDKYLVTVKNGNVYAGTYDAFSGKFQCAATAWQPLPEPYKEEENLK